MNHIFLDTNIIIDFLGYRTPHYDPAKKLFILAETERIKINTSTLSIAIVYYILSRKYGSKKTKKLIKDILLLIRISGVDDKTVFSAINNSDFNDFEDAIQYYSAVENNSETIITRNKEDFKHSKIPVYTAQEFLLKFEQEL